MINKRLVDTSCDPAEFNKAKGIYETALKANGYEAKMSYVQQPTPPRHRGRKIIWFNPPYNRNVKTNIGKLFLKLLKKHFTRDHKYFKIFNINTIKISYCCTSNIGNLIKQHNSNVLMKGEVNDERPCNCRVKENCPLNGNCLAKNVVYEAKINHGTESMIYYGLCEGVSFQQPHKIIQKQSIP